MNVARNGIRLSFPFERLKAGKTLRTRIDIRDELQDDFDELRITLAGSNGIIDQQRFNRLPKEGLTCTFKIPSETHLFPVMIAFMKTKSMGEFYSRIRLPEFNRSSSVLTLTPEKKTLLPGEESILSVNLMDSAGNPSGGAATVMITDASILAREGRATVEDALSEWAIDAAGYLNIPPVMTAAYEAGMKLSFRSVMKHFR